MHEQAFDLWSEYVKELPVQMDEACLMKALLAANSMDCCEDRVKYFMAHIATISSMPECDYSELHHMWVRSPCGPHDLWQRQRAAKLEFDRHQVDACETSRVVRDPEHRILRRIR